MVGCLMMRGRLVIGDGERRPPRVCGGDAADADRARVPAEAHRALVYAQLSGWRGEGAKN